MHALVNIYRIHNNEVLAILISGPRSEKQKQLLLSMQYPQREYFLLKLSYDGDPMLSGSRIKYLLHASRIRTWPHLILRHANFITNKPEKNSVCTHFDVYIGTKLDPAYVFFFSYFILFSFFSNEVSGDTRNVLGIRPKTNYKKCCILVCENRKSF